MSGLSTPDTATAGAFYCSVFGWTTETIDFGGAEATMFRLPGFFGGEPTQPVSRETVATMMAGEQAGWGVDFWVEDADAASAAVTELGGTVLVPAFPTPVGRTRRWLIRGDGVGAWVAHSCHRLPDLGGETAPARHCAIGPLPMQRRDRPRRAEADRVGEGTCGQDETPQRPMAATGSRDYGMARRCLVLDRTTGPI